MEEHDQPEAAPVSATGAAPSVAARSIGAAQSSQPVKTPGPAEQTSTAGPAPSESSAEPSREAAEAQPSPAIAAVPILVTAAYEHPWAIRFTHWLNAVSIFVLTASGLRIFRAFPSFGPKIPQKDFVDVPKIFTLGGWLAGALQWHFTFMWIFIASGVLYIAYQIISGHYRTVLFTPRDVSGVWPMVRYYFLFGRKPEVNGQYNPLQKLAYTLTVLCGALSLATGLVLYKPIQFSWLAWPMGGYHLTRIWHFAAMCGFLAFIPGHLIMVLLHGWSNFYSMLAGWKRDPEYLAE